MITRIAALGLLAASMLMTNAAQAEVVINKPAVAMKIFAVGFIPSSAAMPAGKTLIPTVGAEKATAPVAAPVLTLDTQGTRGTVQMASWYGPFINWLRNVLAIVANGMRAGSRTVREWMQRVADWCRNHLGGSAWVNVKGNGDCDAYVVPPGPVWGICHGHVNGGFDVEVHTK